MGCAVLPEDMCSQGDFTGGSGVVFQSLQNLVLERDHEMTYMW